MPFESNIETGRISVMKGSRQASVKVVFFHLRGHGHLQDNATPNLFPDSKSFLLGLSNEASFASGFLGKVFKNSKNVFVTGVKIRYSEIRG